MSAIPTLARIQRTNLILGAAAVAIAGLLWGGSGMVAAGAGAALACADFWVLGRLGAAAVARVKEGGSPWGLGFALIAKMAALFAIVYVAIRIAGLAVLPFALGFSVFVISILLVGLSAATTEAQLENR